MNFVRNQLNNNDLYDIIRSSLFSFFLSNLTVTPKKKVLTLLSGLLLTLLAVAEAKVIETKVSRNNMFSEFSVRGFPIDIIQPVEINVTNLN